ncbi:MAG: hypothetical protein WDW38_010043 [Sanguina aurantia]
MTRCLSLQVGTSMGFLYVLNSDGSPREGWPIQMGEIQGQPLVADLNNDGQLEICVGDTRGNIAAWSASGEEIWERHVKSLISQAAVAADINGDGEIEGFGAAGLELRPTARRGRDIRASPLLQSGSRLGIRHP